MEFTTLIALLSFQLTIIAIVAIVYNRDKLASMSISGLIKLLDRLIPKPNKSDMQNDQEK